MQIVSQIFQFRIRHDRWIKVLDSNFPWFDSIWTEHIHKFQKEEDWAVSTDSAYFSLFNFRLFPVGIC